MIGSTLQRVAHLEVSPGASLDRNTSLVLVRIGGQRFALNIACVRSLLRMTALTPIPEPKPGLVGLLNFHGTLLPVVDPRPRLAIPTPLPHPDQYLVLLSSQTQYLLWVDGAETVVDAPCERVVGSDASGAPPISDSVARIDGGMIPILSAAALDPGPVSATLEARA